MREAEKKSANILESFLKKEGYKVSFEDGTDPPDIVFYVNEEKWAVEHTQLHQYSDFNDDEISRVGIDSQIVSFEEYINQQMKNELKNKWILAIKGPISKNNLVKIEKEVTEIIYKEDNNSSFKISNTLYSLEKVINENPKIVLYSILSPNSRIPNSAVLTCDIQEQINYSVDRILNAKLSDFQQMVSYVKKVLLIESQYMFSTQENVKKSFSGYPDLLEIINSVYLINYEGVHLIY